MSSETKRGRGRPRREGTDDQILAITRSLLRQRGYRELTLEQIAEAAGVAKTTIYRRWRSKGALIAAATTPSGPAPADVQSILDEVRALLLPLAGAEDDAEILGVIRAILSSRRDALIALLQDDTRSDQLLGALFMRLFVAQSSDGSAPGEERGN